jgi:hypothetical protein
MPVREKGLKQTIRDKRYSCEEEEISIQKEAWQQNIRNELGGAKGSSF